MMKLKKVNSGDGYVRLFEEESGDYSLQFVYGTRKKDEWDYIYEMPFNKKQLEELKKAIEELIQSSS